jgi:Family of unknown function (DUF6112)
VVVRFLSDISVHPDVSGLPPNVVTGLEHLANNAAGLLVIVAGLGIALSLIGWVFGSSTGNQQVTERAKSSLGVSIAALALLYIGIAAANYAGHLFS